MLVKRKSVGAKTPAKKILTRFRPQIRSRHPSHSPLRRELPLLPWRSIVRLGSTTSGDGLASRIEINSVRGIKNSADKLKMKQCFTQAGVKTARWWYTWTPQFQNEIDNNIPHTINFMESKKGTNNAIITTPNLISNLPYPIIAKHRFGSRGTGNYKLDTQQALQQWMIGKDLSNYIFEEFVKMSREYRLHISKNGCFYACRKLLRMDAPEGTWQRHDDVVTWALESNPSFKKPNNWEAIVADCIRAQTALGLDICAFDVMVQGSKKGKERINPEWIIVESASAPSFGDITTQKYIEEIPKLIKDKANR